MEATKDLTRGGRAVKGVGKPNWIEGKTKIIKPLYEKNNIHDTEYVKIITKDSLTANDGEKSVDTNLAKDKTSQTCNIFKYLKRKNIPVNFIKQESDTSFIAEKANMVPIEIVIRRKPYGSYLKRHPDTPSNHEFDPPLVELFHKQAVVPPVEHCDNPHGLMPTTRIIPEGRARELYMKNGKWTHTVYTDPFINILEDGTHNLHPAKEKWPSEPLYTLPILPFDSNMLSWVKWELARASFLALEEAWKKFNIKLIDLKIEVGAVKPGLTSEGKDDENMFGPNQTDNIIICDVIDNDSWRIWPNGDPTLQLDKQSFRDGEDLSEVEKKYRIVTEYTKKF
tara:strand:+ start:116 stop:1129 length:1014 start_codon:yes stop_codon:yes gene_type:complete